MIEWKSRWWNLIDLTFWAVLTDHMFNLSLLIIFEVVILTICLQDVDWFLNLSLYFNFLCFLIGLTPVPLSHVVEVLSRFGEENLLLEVASHLVLLDIGLGGIYVSLIYCCFVLCRNILRWLVCHKAFCVTDSWLLPVTSSIVINSLSINWIVQSCQCADIVRPILILYRRLVKLSKSIIAIVPCHHRSFVAVNNILGLWKTNRWKFCGACSICDGSCYF